MKAVWGPEAKETGRVLPKCQSFYMGKLTFFIPHTPKSQGRHRKGRNGFYPDPDSEKYKKIVQSYAQEAILKAGSHNFPISGPVSMEMFFCIPIPRSWSKKATEQAQNGMIKHTFKPDLDNLEKIVMDALNKLVYVDDAQVCEKNTRKEYAPASTPAGTFVAILY